MHRTPMLHGVSVLKGIIPFSVLDFRKFSDAKLIQTFNDSVAFNQRPCHKCMKTELRTYIGLCRQTTLSSSTPMSFCNEMMNIGASRQLECWNTGKMEYWVLEKWMNVLLGEILLININNKCETSL